MDIALAWKRIDWLPNQTWSKNTLPELLRVGLKAEDLKRCVYVIRLNGDYCVGYPCDSSPTVYIGEGDFNQRINSHKVWIQELTEFVGEFSFEVRIAIPRVKNNAVAYKDCEAALLIRFRDKFGSAPLWNKQIEKRRSSHFVYNEAQMDQAICKGSGAKYKWSFQPMRSSLFYANFVKTHVDKCKRFRSRS